MRDQFRGRDGVCGARDRRVESECGHGAGAAVGLPGAACTRWSGPTWGVFGRRSARHIGTSHPMPPDRVSSGTSVPSPRSPADWASWTAARFRIAREARATQQENSANRLRLDPAIKCYLPGVPRATYMPFPFQIIQSQEHIMVVHEFANAVRTVYMDNHTDPPAPTWMGWSNGHWDGETLVVDTRGFNGMTWFDRAGNFHSDALHVVERFTARSPETLTYEVTIEDPNVFTRPWTMTMPLYRRVDENVQLVGVQMRGVCRGLDLRTSPEAAGPVTRHSQRGKETLR